MATKPTAKEKTSFDQDGRSTILMSKGGTGYICTEPGESRTGTADKDGER